MEGRSSTADSHYQYQSEQWSRLVRRNTLAEAVPISSITSPAQLPPQLDLIPSLLPQQSSFHQAQLAQYNRLISGARGNRLQSTPLPPLLSAHHIQAVPGSPFSASGINTAKNINSGGRIGHGNKDLRRSSKGERVLMTEREAAVKMPQKKMEISIQQLPTRPLPQHQNTTSSMQSMSVPSTPHHHPRDFSFESREPSPTAITSHSPRSAYSESNLISSSSRLPAMRGGCRFETALAYTKRRIPYSIGAEKLEKLPPADIKSKMSRDEETKLTTDMEELYRRLLPTPDCESRRAKLVRKLEKLFNDKWPGHNTRVHVFGSSGNLLCTDESDVDICITTEMKEMEGVCIIADLLAKNGMEKVICVSTAKVPIVKIWDPELGLACDMNVNNTLALDNTRMIKTYVQIDDRVRQLAMIIKHWTKKRIVNDAAFGGTLSSYTWICMIINFLQSRDPPVLPALHQRPHMKLPARNKVESAFADDLEALKALGQPNKETLGELLFAFFRFYAHEFDYDKLVISVRNGKQIPKVDKGWHITNNNRLCVEEPFNTVRNLGNTADDTSWRGLHLELRRAFDLISQAKLEECCEEYRYPKEEERVWERPKAKPVVIRSLSTSRGGRGGSHRGGSRHTQNNRNGNSNRRASSAGYDHNSAFTGPPPHSSQEAWINRQAQAQLHNDLYATYSVLQAQENSLRLQLYAQGLQAQAYAQSHAQAQAQGFGANGAPIKQQAVDRNRGNSIDQGPMTAPLRPETYYWPLHYPVTPHMYPGYQPSSTNPSSPSLGPAVPELRRSLHRSTVTNGSTVGVPQSSSSLRSHSQPAARSLSSQPAVVMGNPEIGVYQPYRQARRAPIPSFIADENFEPGFDSRSGSVVTAPDDSNKEYVGYYVTHDAASPSQRQQHFQPIIPTFGDIGQSRRRLSTDQLPQSILDRIKRTSRSPSPLGHDRSFSLGTNHAPLSVATSQHGMSSNNLRVLNTQGPLVVNGSNLSPLSIPHWQASVQGSLPMEDANLDIPGGSLDSLSQTSTTESEVSRDHNGTTQVTGDKTPTDTRVEAKLQRPLIVNGSTPLSAGDSSSPAPINGNIPRAASIPNGKLSTDRSNGSIRLSPKSRSRLIRPSQNGGMSPLDIGLSQNENSGDDLHNLSPVYENRTPSPTTSRKFEVPLERRVNGTVPKQPALKPEAPKLISTGSPTTSNINKQNLAPAKVNGHTRNAKSEGAKPGTWQISKGKKKGSTLKSPGGGQSQGEKLPSNQCERKGG